jgi:hypothetical protein
MEVCDPVPVTRSRNDIHIVVAGADAPASAVACPWGLSHGQWHPVL